MTDLRQLRELAVRAYQQIHDQGWDRTDWAEEPASAFISAADPLTILEVLDKQDVMGYEVHLEDAWTRIDSLQAQLFKEREARNRLEDEVRRLKGQA